MLLADYPESNWKAASDRAVKCPKCNSQDMIQITHLGELCRTTRMRVDGASWRCETCKWEGVHANVP